MHNTNCQPLVLSSSIRPCAASPNLRDFGSRGTDQSLFEAYRAACRRFVGWRRVERLLTPTPLDPVPWETSGGNARRRAERRKAVICDLSDRAILRGLDQHSLPHSPAACRPIVLQPAVCPCDYTEGHQPKRLLNGDNLDVSVLRSLPSDTRSLHRKLVHEATLFHYGRSYEDQPSEWTPIPRIAICPNGVLQRLCNSVPHHPHRPRDFDPCSAHTHRLPDSGETHISHSTDLHSAHRFCLVSWVFSSRIKRTRMSKHHSSPLPL